jgi:beta-glucosidase
MVWEQKIQPDHAHAAAAAVRAGNDMVMTTPQFFEGAQEAIEAGLLAEADLDRAVARILTLKFELGLFEDPRRPDAERAATLIGSAEHAAVNLDLARRSLVLLRNIDGTLPMTAADDLPRRIAVVGPLADAAQAQLGDWAGSSGQADWLPDGHPRDMITTVLDGLRELTPQDWTVTSALGAEILSLVTPPEGATFPDGQPRPKVVVPRDPDEALIAQAVAQARDADYVVAVVGDQVELVGEGRSTATLELVGGQVALLDALAETGTPLVVVVMASKPLVLPQSALDAAAVVWTANPGMEGGRAVAELLLGQIEPSGRLPISFARHVGQQPIYYNQLRGQHGDRYADLTQEPAFVFGEGLSYTTVEYSGLGLRSAELGPEDTIHARVTLTNTGARPARETVQVYVSDTVTSVSWTDKELKAYRQVDVAPGQSVVVELDLPVADCTIVDQAGNRVVEPGGFELLVGSSSRDADLLRVPFSVSGSLTGH